MASRNVPSPPSNAEDDLAQAAIDAMMHGGSSQAVPVAAEVALASASAEAGDDWSLASISAELETAQAGQRIASPAPAPTPGAREVAVAAPVTPAPAAAPTSVHPIEFGPLAPVAAGAHASHSIELLLDIQLEVRVEIGQARMSIRDVLALRSGSVVELDRLAGEPVDVLVGDADLGTLVARGEVVVVDEKFGVRITEIVSPDKRLASLTR